MEEALNNDNNESIVKLTNEIIQQRKRNIIHELFPPNHRRPILQKLKHYRNVDEINDIRVGCYARWINIDTKKLSNGGIIIKVDINQDGIYVVFKNYLNQIFTIQLNHVFLFQKITNQEHIILTLIDKISKS